MNPAAPNAGKRVTGKQRARILFDCIPPEPKPCWIDLWNALVPCAPSAPVNLHHFRWPALEARPEALVAVVDSLYAIGVAQIVRSLGRRNARSADRLWALWMKKRSAAELDSTLVRGLDAIERGHYYAHPGARGWRPAWDKSNAWDALWRRTAGSGRGSVQAQLWWSGSKTGWRWRAGRGSNTATQTRWGVQPTYRVLEENQARTREDAVEAADAGIARWAGTPDDLLKPAPWNQSAPGCAPEDDNP